MWVQKTYPYPALGLHCESVKKEVGVQRQSSTSHSPKTAKFSATSIFLTQTCPAMNTPTNHKIGLAGARAYHQKAGRGQQYVQFFFTNYNAVNNSSRYKIRSVSVLRCLKASVAECWVVNRVKLGRPRVQSRLLGQPVHTPCGLSVVIIVIIIRSCLPLLSMKLFWILF